MKKFLWFILISMSINSYAQTCDPFTIKCRQATSVLTRYKLSELHMVGSIHQDNKILAIIRTPNNHIYPVSIGDKIGIEGGRVSQINSQQVMIAGKNIETLWLKCYS